MKLNKKYCKLVDEDKGYDNQLLADNCEKIADEFAISFAEWCFENYNSIDGLNKKVIIENYKREKRL